LTVSRVALDRRGDAPPESPLTLAERGEFIRPLSIDELTYNDEPAPAVLGLLRGGRASS